MTTRTATTAHNPPVWTSGDWNAFFGFGTNILVNMLVLTGLSITFISMRPALEMYMTPVIGLTCFAVIMVSWFGGFRYPKGIPAGLVAIAVGMVIAWGSNLFGLDYGGLSVKGIGDAFTN